MLSSLLAVCDTFRQLEARRKALVAKAVALPELAERNGDFLEALSRLVSGKSAFALPFGKGDARKLVASVTVLGSSPSSREAWTEVHSYVRWRLDSHREVARWISIAGEFGLEPPSTAVDAAVRHVFQQQTWVGDAKRFIFDVERQLHDRIEKVFGKRVADVLWNESEAFLDEVRTSLNAHLDCGRLAYAMKRVGELLKKLQDRSGPVVEVLRRFFLKKLGALEADEGALQAEWKMLQADLSRLNRLRGAFADIARVTSLIESAGAPKWAARLRTVPVSNDSDAALPARWHEAWSWRLAYLFLERIDAHSKLRELFDERRTLTTTLART